MAYLTDEQKRQQEQNPEQERDGGDLQKTGDVTPTVGPSSATAQKSNLSTGMKGTQAQKYVKAHQAPKLAERIMGKLQEKEAGLTQQIGQERGNIEQQTGLKMSDSGLQQIQTEQGKGTGAIGAIRNIQPVAKDIAQKNSSEIQQFTQSPQYQEYLKARDFQYKPIESEAVQRLPGQVQELQQTAKQAETERGRFGLLRDMFGRKDKEYTQGQQSLDQLLLQQAPGEAQKLADYSKTAGAQALKEAEQTKQLQALANETIQKEGEQLRKDIEASARAGFESVPASIQQRIIQYNQNKDKLTGLLSRVLSGQDPTQEDIDFFRTIRDRNPTLANELRKLEGQRMYNAQFKDLATGAWLSVPSSAMTNWRQPGESIGSETDITKPSAYDYNFGAMTPEEIQTLIAKDRLNELRPEDQYKFLTQEDIAKQRAIESLYGELGTEYNQDIFNQRYADQGLTPTNLESAINLQQYMQGRRGTASDKDTNLGLGYEGRKTAIERNIEAGSLKNATDIHEDFYANFGQHSGMGNMPVEYKGTASDPVAVAYEYLRPDRLSQYANKKPAEMIREIAFSPNVDHLFNLWARQRIENMSKVRILDPNPSSENQYINVISPDLYQKNLIDAKMDFAKKIVDKQQQLYKDAEAMRGGYFSNIRKLFT